MTYFMSLIDKIGAVLELIIIVPLALIALLLYAVSLIIIVIGLGIALPPLLLTNKKIVIRVENKE